MRSKNSKIIQVNIKNLRSSWNETQEDLALAIGVGATSISNYERGDREVSIEVLVRIAEHYCVTVEELIKDEIPATKIDASFEDVSKVKEFCQSYFPTFCTKKAMQNTDFKRAYGLQEELESSIDKYCVPKEDLWRACFDSYYQAYYRGKIIEAAANYLKLYLYLEMCLNQPWMLKEVKKLYKRELSSKDFLRRIMLVDADPQFEKQEQIDENYILKKLQFPKETEKFYELLKGLCSNKKMKEYAEFYLSIKYMMGLVDNGLSRAANRSLGESMIMIQNTLGNRFSINYIKGLIEQYSIVEFLQNES